MRQIVLKLLLLGFAVTFAAGTGEIVVRTIMPQDVGIWRTTRDGLITLRPGIDVYLPSFDRNVRTNDWGLRDAQHTSEPQPDVFRIVLLGDSFMEALQVATSDAFPSGIASRLTVASGRPVEVINAGVSGWGTEDQLTWFRRVGRNLNPDLVLVAMTLHNDVSDNLAFRFHDFHEGRLVEKPIMYVPLPKLIELEIKGWLAFHSQLYRLVTVTLRSSRNLKAVQVLDAHVAALFKTHDDQIDRGWQITTELLDNLKLEATDVGATTAVFLIPLAVQLTDAALAQFLELHDVINEDLQPAAPQDRMAQWELRSRVDVIDLLPAFRAHANQHPGILYLPNDGHWNEIGHALAAETVSGQLMRLGLIPRSDTP